MDDLWWIFDLIFGLLFLRLYFYIKYLAITINKNNMYIRSEFRRLERLAKGFSDT